jgi:hypothetical protein
MAGIVTGNYRIRKGLPSIWIVGDKTGGAAGACAPGSDIAAFLASKPARTPIQWSLSATLRLVARNRVEGLSGSSQILARSALFIGRRPSRSGRNIVDWSDFGQGHRTAGEAPDLLAAGRPSRAVPSSVDHEYFGEATGVARWTGSRKASA